MSAQRKLADAEAALKQAKEEARRATAEAERAKAEAKKARESEAAVKQKLADAEAARAKAEQACHTDTTRPSLGGDCEGGWDERQIHETIRHASVRIDEASGRTFGRRVGLVGGEPWTKMLRLFYAGNARPASDARPYQSVNSSFPTCASKPATRILSDLRQSQIRTERNRTLGARIRDRGSVSRDWKSALADLCERQWLLSHIAILRANTARIPSLYPVAISQKILI